MLVVVTPPKPNELPVSLDHFKQHMRVTHNAEDELYRHYIAAATAAIQHATSRVLRSTVYELTSGCFVDEFDLPVGPIATVDSVTYFDSENASQTVDAADYRLLSETETTGILCGTWPASYTRPDAVTIRFTAGHASLDEVPANAKQAVLLLASHYSTNREAVNSEKLNEVPMALRHLVASLSVGRYAVE